MTHFVGSVNLSVDLDFECDHPDGSKEFYRALDMQIQDMVSDGMFNYGASDIEIEECPSFKSYEYYDIDMDNGEKVLHIFGCVWENDGRVDDRTGQLVPYTVTEYTGCYIPVKDLVACENNTEKWDLIMDAEASVQQYEGDYSWKQLLAEGYGTPSSPNGVFGGSETCDFGKELHYSDITLDTPCGEYHYYY